MVQVIKAASPTGHVLTFEMIESHLYIIDDAGLPHPYGMGTIEGAVLTKHGIAEYTESFNILN